MKSGQLSFGEFQRIPVMKIALAFDCTELASDCSWLALDCTALALKVRVHTGLVKIFIRTLKGMLFYKNIFHFL